jgi:hypothetical protein
MYALRHAWRLPVRGSYHRHARRALQTVATSTSSEPDFAFAFELSARRMPLVPTTTDGCQY